jgi:aryl-alcohol dehydrogenase-like predicted oxidoreductase
MQPGVTSTILGARSVAQLEDNLGALKVQLDEAAMQRLNEASAFPDIYPYRFVRDMDAR